MKKDCVEVRLTIYDFDCPPEQITQTLRIAPSRTWQKGDAVPGTKRRERENGWVKHAPGFGDNDLQGQVASLLSVMVPLSNRFGELPPHSKVELSCMVFLYEGSVSISFSSQDVAGLAELGAEIDVDCYDLR